MFWRPKKWRSSPYIECTQSETTIVLRYQEDLDPVEIGRTLKMPVNTVKSHLKRSLALLRERIAVPGPGAGDGSPTPPRPLPSGHRSLI